MARDTDPIQLLRRVVLKDRAAFERFYDTLSPLVFGLALRMLRDRPEAEELTQDVFYQVWRQAENYSKERGMPEAWLIAMTRSRAIDRLRARRRRPEALRPVTEEGDEALRLASPGNGPAPGDRLLLEELLGGLSGPQHAVIRMAYFEGLTQTEIATRLGEPLGTVKTRVRDGLRQLRRLVEERKKGRTA